MKECAKCGETKPADEFRPLKPHDLTKRHSACKECKAEYSRQWYEANKEKIAVRSRERYRANPEMEAARRRKYYEANKEKVAVRNKAYTQANKEKVAERYRKWAAANPEKLQEYKRRYHEKHPERARENYRKWAEANPEKMRAASRKYAANNREKRAEYARQWKESGQWREWWDEYYRENSDKYFESSARRRARLAEAESDGHTLAELRDYWVAGGVDPKVCTYCDGPISNWKTSVGDHVLPMNKGGPDVVENLAPCCGGCNASKSDRLLHVEWTPPNMRAAA